MHYQSGIVDTASCKGSCQQGCDGYCVDCVAVSEGGACERERGASYEAGAVVGVVACAGISIRRANGRSIRNLTILILYLLPLRNVAPDLTLPVSMD